jgi:hypothetical protein
MRQKELTREAHRWCKSEIFCTLRRLFGLDFPRFWIVNRIFGEIAMIQKKLQPTHNK